MTVIENVMVGYQSHLRAGWLGAVLRTRRTKTEVKEAVERGRQLLGFVGLSGRGDLMAKNLPYGDQRRLEIARALATQPDLLLLDEPAAGMNPEESLALVELIEQIHATRDLAIVLIEHHMDVVMNLCSRITVLNFGSVIAEGTPEEIQANPVVLKAYLGDKA
jgi:branched-chain amino acid transport system ATP-binding protein